MARRKKWIWGLQCSMWDGEEFERWYLQWNNLIWPLLQYGSNLTSHHIISYHIISHLIISYHITYHIIFYHIILHNNILYHIMSNLKSYSRLFSVTSIITCLTQGPLHVDTVHPWPSIKGIEVLRRNGLVIDSISWEKAHKACWRQQSICEFLLPISTWKDARLVKPNSDARLREFIVY